MRVVLQFSAQCTKELKTRQVLVRFDLRFLTGQIAKKTGHLATLFIERYTCTQLVGKYMAYVLQFQ